MSAITEAYYARYAYENQTTRQPAPVRHSDAAIGVSRSRGDKVNTTAKAYFAKVTHLSTNENSTVKDNFFEL